LNYDLVIRKINDGKNGRNKMPDQCVNQWCSSIGSVWGVKTSARKTKTNGDLKIVNGMGKRYMHSRIKTKYIICSVLPVRSFLEET